MGLVMNESYLLVFCTVSNLQESKKISKILIEKRLAACCNIIGGFKSIYRWQENIEETDEHLLLIKTAEKHYDQLEKEIKMIHSYSVPEVIAVPIEKGSAAYLDWMKESLDL